jgi:uncharacterized membrane protein
VRRFSKFVTKAFASGLLIAVPIYLATLLMLKAIKSAAALVKPLAALYPAGLSTGVAEQIFAFVIVSAVCTALGVIVLTRPGRAARERIERSVLEKIPGYALVRSLTQQLAGQGRENVWKPALTEMANGLVFSFIIEEIGDGRCAVFVPGVPSPVSGSVYILPGQRVHPLSASFAQTFQVLSRWGSGAKNLVPAIRSEGPVVKPGSTGVVETERTKIA